MPRLPRPARLALFTPLLAAGLAACGGGGGGGDAPPPQVPPPPPVSAVDVQSLPTARLLFDIARTTALLSADVQNLIVLAPSLVARGDRTEACDQGGSLVSTVVRGPTHPEGPLLRQQFNDCRSGGLWLRGSTETSYTRRVTDSADQPWSGSVRFFNYRIDSLSGTARQRRYDGLATAEGSLGVGSLAQGRSMRLTDFTLEDNPDTLGRGGLISTTARFDVRRSAGALGDPYTLEGRWLHNGGTLATATTLEAGSQVSLVENTGSEALRGTLVWRDTVVPSFDARFTLRPGSTRTAVRLELDINDDGRLDRDVTLDRYGATGIGL
jgi:hypothetical protein